MKIHNASKSCIEKMSYLIGVIIIIIVILTHPYLHPRSLAATAYARILANFEDIVIRVIEMVNPFKPERERGGNRNRKATVINE